MPFQPHPSWAALIEDEQQPWRTLSSRELIGPPRRVWEDRVQVRPGVQTTYQYHPRGHQAIFVLPVTDAGDIVLIRQYRYPLRATITEIVAGGVEAGEQLLDAAARELKEEVGGVATEWVALPGFYPQPSINGVVFFPMLALGVSLGEMAHEDTETIERLTLPLAEAYAMLERGEIQSGSSSLVMWQARAELVRRGLL
ncbi:DNA mismatch repair protein MutT [Deinococcus piscis]|uniref:DNA mismatch repair protein MutT n=1 Tax=Deinococcus piscis TaxID=394230 RepID=A0ABQ3K2M7_9DEIO|nr:NUDIX hydrolase [Deinococcus piscis]GHG01241.1 DNA mismatch repair protein MutT [Deinococcus piscis]